MTTVFPLRASPELRLSGALATMLPPKRSERSAGPRGEARRSKGRRLPRPRQIYEKIRAYIKVRPLPFVSASCAFLARSIAAALLASVETVRADIQVVSADVQTGAGIALVANGPIYKDLDRWRAGQLDGWGGCILVKSGPSGDDEICGCLGRQLSAVGPIGVRVAVDNITACASVFISGAWNSSWSQDIADQAPASFQYDPNAKTLSGCWAEHAGEGRITGVIKNAKFSMSKKTLSFSYEDLYRGVSGEAAMTLATNAQSLTLLGTWSHAGGSGAWTMTRDPVRMPLPCMK